MNIAPHRKSAGAAGGYFVRDDDVGEKSEELEFFVRLFVAHRLPVSYQIIPARLTEECAAFMLDMAAAHPDLIEFGQHGLHHAMDVGGRRLKREFGPERSLQDQAADIAEGLALLRARLGPDLPIEVFTPPQHKFDRNTVLAVARSGHRVFSAAAYASPHHQAAYAVGRRLGLSSIRHHGISYNGGMRPEAAIFERSISIAVDNGRAITCGANRLPAAISIATRSTEPVGFMTHHAVYAGSEGRAALTAIAEQLAACGPPSFHRLGDLAWPVSPAIN